MRMQLTFKSGAQVEVDVDSFETGKHPLDGHLVRLSWETPADWMAKLHRVSLDEIVAIVALRTAKEAEADEPAPSATEGATDIGAGGGQQGES